MTILVWQRISPDLNLTIYDETKFSSCHTPYTNNILYPVSSYNFLRHKTLFQAGNFNVNIRPNLLYFSIWGVYSKLNIPKHNLWPVKQLKLCAHHQEICLMKYNTLYEDHSCTSCFKSEGTKKYWMPLVICMEAYWLLWAYNLNSDHEV